VPPVTREVEVGGSLALALPGEATRRLAAGAYRLRPEADGLQAYPFEFQVTAAEPDSPMQRILYHEFGGSPFAELAACADDAERIAFLGQYADEVRRLGFTRTTDRRGNQLTDPAAPQAWRPEQAPVSLAHPGFAPAAWYRLPNREWVQERYLDEAVRCGLAYDTQLLYHCDGVKFRDVHLDRFVPAIQRLAQCWGAIPRSTGSTGTTRCSSAAGPRAGPTPTSSGWRGCARRSSRAVPSRSTCFMPCA
jgi:hypothetical protein